MFASTGRRSQGRVPGQVSHSYLVSVTSPRRPSPEGIARLLAASGGTSRQGAGVPDGLRQNPTHVSTSGRATARSSRRHGPAGRGGRGAGAGELRGRHRQPRPATGAPRPTLCPGARRGARRGDRSRWTRLSVRFRASYCQAALPHRCCAPQSLFMIPRRSCWTRSTHHRGRRPAEHDAPEHDGSSSGHATPKTRPLETLTFLSCRRW